MNAIPTFQNANEDLFKKLVTDGLTLTAIRQEMSPMLDEFDDISLIRKMLQITQGEN